VGAAGVERWWPRARLVARRREPDYLGATPALVSALPILGIALRGNDTLAQLDILHTNRIAGQTIIRLSVPELNGSKVVGDARRVDLSRTCIEGAMGRVACSMIGD
jgi:hypothetical protein